MCTIETGAHSVECTGTFTGEDLFHTVQMVTHPLDVNTQQMNTNSSSNVTALGNTQGGMSLSEESKFQETLQQMLV